MCNSNAVFTSKLLKHDINPSLLPVAIDVETKMPVKQRKNWSKWNVAWMSRLEIPKTRALMLLAQDLGNYAKKTANCEIIIHVIGEGGAEAAIKRELLNHGLEFRFPGRLEAGNLKEYICRNIDVAFGMGMSALEFAAQGVPAVFTIGEIFSKAEAERPDKYKWVFDSIGYDVTSEPAMYGQNNLVSVRDIFDRLKREPELLAQKSYDYVFDNHSVPHAADKLAEAISECSFRVADLKQAKLHSKCFEDLVFESYLGLKQKLKTIKAQYI
jgi:hypothetical protein